MNVFIYLESSFLGLQLATAMVNAGLTTFSKIELTSPRELELVSQNILHKLFRSLSNTFIHDDVMMSLAVILIILTHNYYYNFFF